jgi:hypothetical protein
LPIANLARFYRNFGNIYEKLQIAKNFIKIHISKTKLRIFHLPVEAKNKNYKNQFTQTTFQVVSGVKWQLKDFRVESLLRKYKGREREICLFVSLLRKYKGREREICLFVEGF